jgi:hypothetical protein
MRKVHGLCLVKAGMYDVFATTAAAHVTEPRHTQGLQLPTNIRNAVLTCQELVQAPSRATCWP